MSGKKIIEGLEQALEHARTPLTERLRDARYNGQEAMRAEAANEIERMEKVCDSYAAENQRFHDEIERLRAELATAYQRAADTLPEMAWADRQKILALGQ